MMYIGEFAEKAGVSLDTIRYYDKIGLLSPERKGKARWYREEDLKKFKEIQLIKSLNFTLEEIKLIMELDESLEAEITAGKSADEVVRQEKETVTRMKELLEEKLTELSRQE